MDSEKPVNSFQDVHEKVKAAKDLARIASEADTKRRRDKEEEAFRESFDHA
jgi:hypothetical protein